jgi:hypothetical protein
VEEKNESKARDKSGGASGTAAPESQRVGTSGNWVKSAARRVQDRIERLRP